MRRDSTGFAAAARDDGLRPGGQPGQGTILIPGQASAPASGGAQVVSEA
jgi:hypothetical protein